ncbi:MAG: Smr/MutS family protein [Deltaproteobacteria bacterium]|jgi:DNA-nicking Smr family endonuclease|nr:Smr/MutS family protein [Deltaproteobacteria bacterium]
MAKGKNKDGKMAGTGIRLLHGEQYPFGEGAQEPAAFSDLFDGESFDEGALQRQAARRAEDKRELQEAGLPRFLPPQETLDLHGCTALEAEVKTHCFLEEAGRRGVKKVRIITGKGLHSPGGKAVLPDLIELQLALLRQEGIIAAFQWDRKVKSKSGALFVYL